MMLAKIKTPEDFYKRHVSRMKMAIKIPILDGFNLVLSCPPKYGVPKIDFDCSEGSRIISRFQAENNPKRLKLSRGNSLKKMKQEFWDLTSYFTNQGVDLKVFNRETRSELHFSENSLPDYWGEFSSSCAFYIDFRGGESLKTFEDYLVRRGKKIGERAWPYNPDTKNSIFCLGPHISISLLKHPSLAVDVCITSDEQAKHRGVLRVERDICNFVRKNKGSASFGGDIRRNNSYHISLLDGDKVSLLTDKLCDYLYVNRQG